MRTRRKNRGLPAEVADRRFDLYGQDGLSTPSFPNSYGSCPGMRCFSLPSETASCRHHETPYTELSVVPSISSSSGFIFSVGKIPVTRCTMWPLGSMTYVVGRPYRPSKWGSSV